MKVQVVSSTVSDPRRVSASVVQMKAGHIQRSLQSQHTRGNCAPWSGNSPVSRVSGREGQIIEKEHPSTNLPSSAFGPWRKSGAREMMTRWPHLPYPAPKVPVSCQYCVSYTNNPVEERDVSCRNNVAVMHSRRGITVLCCIHQGPGSSRSLEPLSVDPRITTVPRCGQLQLPGAMNGKLYAPIIGVCMTIQPVIHSCQYSFSPQGIPFTAAALSSS